MIKVGFPKEILPLLIQEFNVNHLFYQKEITSEEVAIDDALSERLSTLPHEIMAAWGLTFYHVDDVPFSSQDTPLTSKTFRLNFTKKAHMRPCFNTSSELPHIPTVKDWGKLPEATDLGLEDESGLSENSSFLRGEGHALNRLDHHTFETEQLTVYRRTHNRSLGMDYSSKFSYGWLWEVSLLVKSTDRSRIMKVK
jgi:deoxyribodipyrimidine photo-lyase